MSDEKAPIDIEMLREALEQLITVDDSLTTLQYLYQLKYSGKFDVPSTAPSSSNSGNDMANPFSHIDEFEDAHIVRDIVRSIKGPLPEPPLKGASAQVARQREEMRRNPDQFHAYMTHGFDGRGGRVQNATLDDEARDWPEFFMDFKLSDCFVCYRN